MERRLIGLCNDRAQTVFAADIVDAIHDMFLLRD
jgi:hypothetical protein